MPRVTVPLLVFIALQGYVEAVPVSGNPLWKDDNSVDIQTRRGPRTLESHPKDWSQFYPSWWVPSFSSFSSSFKDEHDYDYDMAFLKRRIVALETSYRELTESFKQLMEETKKASCNAALAQEVSNEKTEERPQNVETGKEKPLDSNTGNAPLVPAIDDEVIPKKPQNAETEMKKPLDGSTNEISLNPVINDEVTPTRPQNAENEMKKPLDGSIKEIPLISLVSDEEIQKRPENPKDGEKPSGSNVGEVEKGNITENTKKEQSESVPEGTNGDSEGVVATNVDKGTTLPSKVNEMVPPTRNDDTETVALVNGDEVDKTMLEDGEKAGSTMKPGRVEASVGMEEPAEPRVDYVMELNAELEGPGIVADVGSDIVFDQPEEAIDTIGGAASVVDFAGSVDDGVSVVDY
ncbi:uncharacterized protein LOC128876583 [Hylaeus volcanicus]|uniref:uncharacterized protein LOC128876583 n=1 Tax=Hylaeus volcanicus TaxID=313075 RepID=UPI0023B80691|nr:uncharacterized protein LOC128876583 [Hylaeus volcanicus]